MEASICGCPLRSFWNRKSFFWSLLHIRPLQNQDTCTEVLQQLPIMMPIEASTQIPEEDMQEMVM